MNGRRDKHDSQPPGGRTEPTLGNLDNLDQAPAPSPDGLPSVTVEARPRQGSAARAPARQRRGWRVPTVLLLLLTALVVLWLNQDRLRGMVPRTDLNTMLNQAQVALQEGHLDGQDGSSARELFQSVIALQPDNDAAREGLRKVGQVLLSQADAALQARRFDQAAEQAAVARELLGGGSDIDRLDQQIAQARAAQVQTTDLVDQAEQALIAGRLDGGQGAGALYRRVLQAEPGNAVAIHGLDKVGNALAARAQQALDRNDHAAAEQSIEQLASLQPNNGALPGLRATQAQQRRQQGAALDDALRQAGEAMRAGRISGAGQDSALSQYKAALALDPDNAQARAGLGMVAQALTVQADAALDDGDAEQASKLLEEAAALAPKSAELAAVRARLAGSRLPAQTLDAPRDSPGDTVAPIHLSPQQSAEVARLVKRAAAAMERGDVMLPPGDSAYDLYRSALAIDGNNAPALRGLQSLPVEVERRFERALRDGQLAEAGDMLENLAELSPGDAAQSSLAARLASAWLDQADQQLMNGDRFGAMHALDRAQKLAPNSPRVLDLRARLQAGR